MRTLGPTRRDSDGAGRRRLSERERTPLTLEPDMSVSYGCRLLHPAELRARRWLTRDELQFDRHRVLLGLDRSCQAAARACNRVAPRAFVPFALDREVPQLFHED